MWWGVGMFIYGYIVFLCSDCYPENLSCLIKILSSLSRLFWKRCHWRFLIFSLICCICLFVVLPFNRLAEWQRCDCSSGNVPSQVWFITCSHPWTTGRWIVFLYWFMLYYSTLQLQVRSDLIWSDCRIWQKILGCCPLWVKSVFYTVIHKVMCEY